MDVRVGRLSESQLQSSNTERPDVSLVVVAGLLNHFRCHPERCAYECVLLGHGCRELAGHTKVGEFHLAIGSKEDVRSFDITV